MTEKEFDRLLKGRFFQAPMVKWQRNLEAPKPGETFLELYSRALMLEQFYKPVLVLLLTLTKQAREVIGNAQVV